MAALPAIIWISALLALIAAVAAIWRAGKDPQPEHKPRIITTKLCRRCGARWGSVEGTTCTHPDCPDFR